MINFISEELKNKTIKLIDFLKENKIEYEFYDLSSSEYEGEENIIIDYESTIEIGLPYCEDYDEFGLIEAIELMEEVFSAKLVDDYKYISNKRVLIRVDSLNRERLSLINDVNPDVFYINIYYKGQNYSVDIIDSSYEFGLAVAISGNYSKYNPPMLYEDLFIEICSNNIVNNLVIDNILQAYIFEINSTLGVDIQASPRYKDEFGGNEDEEELYSSIKLRPLILSEDMTELLKLFNQASAFDSSEIQILYYCKVIEYVSQTIVKKELIDSVLNKLLTSRTLSPDAEYVLELERIFEENRAYRVDKESIKLTIITCCDIMEISTICPPFLRKINKLKSFSKKEERMEALQELAAAVSDTRNMIAHAKTNYQFKGNECPKEQIYDFSECVRVVALQVIRWISRQHESSILK